MTLRELQKVVRALLEQYTEYSDDPGQAVDFEVRLSVNLQPGVAVSDRAVQAWLTQAKIDGAGVLVLEGEFVP